MEPRLNPPQGFVSEYAPRLRTHLNSLLAPIIPTAPQTGSSRTTKRGTTAVNYSEDFSYHEEDYEDSDGHRNRYTGLRTRPQGDAGQSRDMLMERLTREVHEPVQVQGIWREWITRPKFAKTPKQLYAQSSLPTVPIPIRIDLDVPAWTPPAALPLPDIPVARHVSALPAYKPGEPTPSYRLKDLFMWNLFETLITPDQFALQLVCDLDLPNAQGNAAAISGQIRQQLEEFSGVVMHPLFKVSGGARGEDSRQAPSAISRDQSQTPAMPATPLPNGLLGSSHLAGPVYINGQASPLQTGDSVNVQAAPMPNTTADHTNPIDAYRCIVTLNINLMNRLYTDKFEWSLLHPPGSADRFAEVTCAELGLHGEWAPAIAHGIYESVLRLKKEACEIGGLVGGIELDNGAIESQEAGWKYDPESLAEDWEPKIEILSKEEIEKREGDRERQIRRLRRETARFSSTTNMAGGVPTPTSSGHLNFGDGDPQLGRGERGKKRRRLRSLSPTGRQGTPTQGSEPMGYGGGNGPTEEEHKTWRCLHCLVHASAVWTIRDGPNGYRSLCNNCGFYFEKEGRLPPNAKGLHRLDQPLIR